MATTNNGIFSIRLEDPASAFYPYSADTDMVLDGTHKLSAKCWDVAVFDVAWNATPTMLETADELRGQTWQPRHDGVGEFAPELTARARVRPQMLALLCYMATGATPTIVVGNDALTDHRSQVLKTGTFQYGFVQTAGPWTAATVPPTATIQFAPAKGSGWAASGCALQTMAFSFDTGALVVDLTFKPLYIKNNDALSRVLHYEAEAPMKRGQMQLDGTIMNVAGSKVTDLTWTIESTMLTFYSFGRMTSETASGRPWPDSVEFDDNWPKVSGTVTKREMLASDYDRVTYPGSDGSHGTFLECIGGQATVLGGTTTKWAFYMHMPAVEYMAVNPENITNKRRIGVSLDWEARADGTNSPCDIYVVGDMVWATVTTMGTTAWPVT
jgi:hypothetical protein